MYQRLLKSRDARRNEDGFTLIELLIVIVILGTLSAIVVFSVRGITDRGEASACKTNISSVNTAIEAYYANEEEYPTQDDDLTGADGFLNAPVPAGVITAYNGTANPPTVVSSTTC